MVGVRSKDRVSKKYKYLVWAYKQSLRIQQHHVVVTLARVWSTQRRVFLFYFVSFFHSPLLVFLLQAAVASRSHSRSRANLHRLFVAPSSHHRHRENLGRRRQKMMDYAGVPLLSLRLLCYLVVRTLVVYVYNQ